jgi:hypothetical protein
MNGNIFIYSSSDDPQLASSTEVTYIYKYSTYYENWFASVPCHDLPDEHAPLWASKVPLVGGDSKGRICLLYLLQFRLGAHDLRPGGVR